MDSDPEIEFIEKDSGMSSPGGSKDETPERRTPPTTVPTTVSSTMQSDTTEKDSYEDEPDETLGERLLGLGEMFPDGVRNFTSSVYDATTSGIKLAYKMTGVMSWIFFTSSLVLFSPVIFEGERAQMAEMMNLQNRQVLFGRGNMPPLAADNNPAIPQVH